VDYTTMTVYDRTFDLPVVFTPQTFTGNLAQGGGDRLDLLDEALAGAAAEARGKAGAAAEVRG
jgi:hypothetical protein